MKHEGLGERCGLLDSLFDADAEISDAACGVASRRHEIGHEPAEAISDRAHFAVAARMAADEGKRRLQILDPLVRVEAAPVPDSAVECSGAPRHDLDARLLTPEEVWADRDIAVGNEIVGEAPHLRIDAEYLLHADDPRTRRGGLRREADIGSEGSAAVGGLDPDLGHLTSLRKR